MGKVSVPATMKVPIITLLGSEYPNNEKDHFSAILGIFDLKVIIKHSSDETLKTKLMYLDLAFNVYVGPHLNTRYITIKIN